MVAKITHIELDIREHRDFTKGGAHLYPCYIPKPLTRATQPLRLGCKIKAHLDDRVAHAVVEMCLVCAPET